jgi:hypothetical protein
MAVRANQLRHALEELIAALDRRLPHVDEAGASAIAQDAGALRASAAKPVVRVIIRPTPFPTRPSDVAALAASEFACAPDLQASVSIEDVCQRFVGDANRAVVWLIRFRALTAWCERTDTGPWLRAEPGRAERACAMAASFVLNEQWEFDAGEFRSAVQSVAP